jgi:ubiquinone/menaquinone biosynthesis C-methylase UbiE
MQAAEPNVGGVGSCASKGRSPVSGNAPLHTSLSVGKDCLQWRLRDRDVVWTEAPLVDYYAQRAREYERIYDKPERQADLAALRKIIRDQLTGHDVLEVACGTGYWTEVIAGTAASVVAIDINREVLEVARAKNFPKHNVTIEQRDVYRLSLAPDRFTAGLGAFWWSHVPKRRLDDFLQQFHRSLQPNALVVFIDNRFVAGSSTPIARVDDEGNSYQTRTLDNGVSYDVLKNFPNESEVRNVVSRFANSVEYTALDYYWCLAYRVATMQSSEATLVRV